MLQITDNLKGARQQIMINHIDKKMLLIGDEGEVELRQKALSEGNITL